MSRSTKQPRRGSGRFDRSCRNHGSCPRCASGRQHKNKRRAPLTAFQEAHKIVAKELAPLIRVCERKIREEQERDQ